MVTSLIDMSRNTSNRSHFIEQEDVNVSPTRLSRTKDKQKRLLALYHSAKCSGEVDSDGRYFCNVNPKCLEMKRLWKHMKKCIDNHCTVQHCFSSRVVLNHFRNCRDEHCDVCPAVRKSIQHQQHAVPNQWPCVMERTTPPTSLQDLNGKYQYLQGNFKAYNPSVVQQVSSSFVNQTVPLNQDAFGCVGGDFEHPTVPPSSSVSAMTNFSSAAAALPNEYYPSEPEQTPPPLSTTSSLGATKTDSGRSSSNSSEEPQAPTRRVNIKSSTCNSDSSFNAAWQTQQNIMRKQQRLLVLRHASECTYRDDDCPVTRHCATMKKLFRHIIQCAEKERCAVKHCISCRHVLNHYNQCNDSSCQVCEPVRQIIRKGKSKKATKRNRTEMSPTQQQEQRQPLTFPPVVKKQKANLEQPLLAKSQLFTVNSKITSSACVDNKKAPLVSTVKVKACADNNNTCLLVGSSLGANGKNGKEAKKDLRTLHGEVEVTSCNSIIQTPLLPSSPPLPSLQQCSVTSHLLPKKRQTCLEILNSLQTHEYGWVFNMPVDPVLLCIPDYFDTIKNPMDLGTINKKLTENMDYETVDDFKFDVHLTFDNAMLYNGEGSDVYNMAKSLKAIFDSAFQETFNCDLL